MKGLGLQPVYYYTVISQPTSTFFCTFLPIPGNYINGKQKCKFEKQNKNYFVLVLLQNKPATRAAGADPS